MHLHEEGVTEIQKSITLQGPLTQTERTTITRTTKELPGNVSRRNPTDKTQIDPTLKKLTVWNSERSPGPHHSRAADKEMDLSVGTRQAEGAINHTPLMIGDRKITETIITVTKTGIPRSELSDGQGPFIFNYIKQFPPPRPREGKS